LREFPLGARPLEVGAGHGCDIVVHDPGVAERALLVRRRGDEVVAYDLSGERPWRGRYFRRGARLPLGHHHSLVRAERSVVAEPAATHTEQLVVPERRLAGLVLSIGRGPEARAHRLDDEPLHVGSAPQNQLVLLDPTVSAHHLRIDRLADGVVVRDLDSSNGTWVDGVRVSAARIGPGAHLRVGRTDLYLLSDEEGRDPELGLVAASPAMQRLLADIRARLARLRWPVLVRGASGAGKEGIARALHLAGPRSGGPFVALNAGGLPRQLVESELFGHELGAFTGAVRAHRGVFEQADGGTLFLDEVAELPLDLQARLLRVIETWEVRRVGSEKTVRVDVRLVSATHRDLRAMVADGAFREDLYYRLAQLVVEVPPLRERPEDIRALAKRFLAEMAPEVGVRRLTEEASLRLLRHAWPGNVRELRNVLASAAASSSLEVVDLYDVDSAIARVGGLPREAGELEHLRAAVELCGGNLAAAARTLGIPRTTLRDRLKGVVKAVETERLKKQA
jgi:transcriptional regulator of acetoin/glycerol metabolism